MKTDAQLLLSDDEVASVSTAEAAAGLSDGDECLDLEQLDRGVRRASATATPMGCVLPEKPCTRIPGAGLAHQFGWWIDPAPGGSRFRATGRAEARPSNREWNVLRELVGKAPGQAPDAVDGAPYLTCYVNARLGAPRAMGRDTEAGAQGGCAPPCSGRTSATVSTTSFMIGVAVSSASNGRHPVRRRGGLVVGGHLGGAPLARASLRVTLGGALAMAATAAIGRILGVSVE